MSGKSETTSSANAGDPSLHTIIGMPRLADISATVVVRLRRRSKFPALTRHYRGLRSLGLSRRLSIDSAWRSMWL